MDNLHKNQEALLKILEQNIDSPLTIREIQEILELSSPSVVAHHIQKLEKKGYLKRNPDNPKDYQVFRNPESPIVYLNLYGSAQCGKNGSILDGNPIDKVPIASRLLRFPVIEGFIVSAKGNSMEPDIKEGDLVIAQKKNAPSNGDIVVCVYNEEALIKKYFYQRKQVTLISLNDKEHPPINVINKFFKVEGIVRNILKYH